MSKVAINPGQASPRPLGSYSHAVRVGDLLFISGQGCRDASTGVERGLSLDMRGEVISYDIEAQTRGVLENLGVVLRSADLDYSDVVDVTVYLKDMGDFESYNKIYGQFFGVDVCPIPPARTTVQVAGLPGRNYIEIKAVASYIKQV